MGLRELFRKYTSFAQPTRAPQTAAIVLRAAHLPDEGIVHGRLRQLWPGDGAPGQSHREDTTVNIAIPGGSLVYQLIAEPFDLGGLRGAIEDASTWWPEAVKSFRGHQAYVRVATSSSVLAPVRTGLVHTAALTAIIEELAAARGAILSGVVWNDERVYPADFVIQHARTASASHPPLPIWLGIHFANPGAAVPAYTSGLTSFGLMNIEVVDERPSHDEVVAAVSELAHRLLTHGPVVKEGDAIGAARAAEARVRLVPSFRRPTETVYRIVW